VGERGGGAVEEAKERVARRALAVGQQFCCSGQ